MQLHYIFNDYPTASKFCLTYKELVETPASLERVTGLVYISLINIAMARWSGGSRHQSRQQRKQLQNAKKCLQALKSLAKYRPENFINKILIVEGELASLQTKQHFCAHEKYICAISLSKTYGFLQDTALAYELYARHLMTVRNHTVNDNDDEVRCNFENACIYYEKWGALAKVKQLRMYMESIAL
jgi:hypothetical protein